MNITFLGTGTSQGVPIIACKCSVCSSKNQKDKRLRSSILIQYNDINMVIDTGPDFRQQMLSSAITTFLRSFIVFVYLTFTDVTIPICVIHPIASIVLICSSSFISAIELKQKP
jgi:hypothetical protein